MGQIRFLDTLGTKTLNGSRAGSLKKETRRRIGGALSAALILLGTNYAVAGPDSPSPSDKVYPETQGLSPEEIAAYQSRFKFDRPISKKEEPVAFGFSVQVPVLKGFWGPATRLSFSRPGRIVAKTGTFGFLEKKVYPGDSFSQREVRSLPSRTYDKAMAQLADLTTKLGGDITDYRFHIRVPSEMSNGIPDDQLKSWLSRISDAMGAQRLQQAPDLAFQNEGFGRVSPNELSGEKGAIRAVKGPTGWDIELHGRAADSSDLKKFGEIILTGLKYPETIKGYPILQDELHKEKHSLVELMGNRMQEAFGRKLSSDEEAFLNNLENKSTKQGSHPTGNMHLFGFENAPYLSPTEADRIRAANAGLTGTVFSLMEGAISGKGDRSKLVQSYREAVSQWAKDADLASTLERSLLVSEKRSRQMPGPVKTREQALAIVLSPKPFFKTEAHNYLGNLPQHELVKLLDNFLDRGNEETKIQTVGMISKDLHGSAHYEPMMTRALSDASVGVREAAIDALADHVSHDEDAASRNLLETAAFADLNKRQKLQAPTTPGLERWALLHSNNHEIRLSAARAISTWPTDDATFHAIDTSLTSEVSDDVRKELLTKLAKIQTPFGYNLLAKGLDDKNPDLKDIAEKAMVKNPAQLPSNLLGRLLDRPLPPEVTEKPTGNFFQRLRTPYSDELEIHRMAVRAAGSRKNDPASLVVLQDAVTHESLAVRDEAKLALLKRNDEGAKDLKKRLGISTFTTRGCALRVLVRGRGGNLPQDLLKASAIGVGRATKSLFTRKAKSE